MRFFYLILVMLCLHSFVNGEGTNDGCFVQVNQTTVVADMKMAAHLKDLMWSSADGVWQPTSEEVLRGLAFIKSPEGRAQVVNKVPAGWDMNPCLKRLDQSRFQVVGFVIEGRRQILYDVIPAMTAIERKTPDLWLKESISKRVYDGGASFWGVLYDWETGSIVASFRRPD